MKTTSKTVDEKGRVVGIDAAKIVASFAVLVLHVIGRGSSILNTILYYLAGFAIPIFFMANGYFVITKGCVSLSYVIKKIFRVVRLILLWSLILFVINQFDSSTTYDNPVIIGVFAIAQRGPLWHFWFFGALCTLWLVSPFLNKLLNRNESGYRRGLVILLSLCLVVQAASLVGAFGGRGALQASVKQVFRLWTWFFYYMLGGYLSFLNDNGELVQLWKKVKDKSPLSLITIGVIILVVIWQAIVGYYALNLIRAEYYYDDISTMLYSLALFLIFIFGKYSVNIKILIEKLVPYTLGIYILHPFVIEVLESFFMYNSALINIIMCPIVFFVSLLCCVVLMKVRPLSYLVNI